MRQPMKTLKPPSKDCVPGAGSFGFQAIEAMKEYTAVARVVVSFVT